MKRILTLLAVISVVLSAIAQSGGVSGILLTNQSGDKIKFYSGNQLYKAIDEAEANDILYLAAGNYNFNGFPNFMGNSYAINKPITIIGAGAQDGGTYFINGWDNLYINIDPQEYTENRNVTFEGVKFGDEFTVRPVSDLDDLTFRNVKFRFSDDSNSESGNEFFVKNLIIDRCCVDRLQLNGGRIENAIVNNSLFPSAIEGSCSTNSEGQIATFDHCGISQLSDSFSGLVTNSIIGNIYSNSCRLESCGYQYSDYSLSEDGCRHIYSDWSYVNDNPTEFGVCEDGSLCGYYGGESPYSLYSSYPTPDNDESSLDYKSINNTLTISVKALEENKSSDIN